MRTANLDRLYQHLVAESMPDEDRGCRVVQKYLKWIARSLGVSVRTVQRHLRRLEALGWIRIEEDFFDHGGHRANRYLLVKERNLPDRLSQGERLQSAMPPRRRSGTLRGLDGGEKGLRRPTPKHHAASAEERNLKGEPRREPSSEKVHPEGPSNPHPPEPLKVPSMAPTPPDGAGDPPWREGFLLKLEAVFPADLLQRPMSLGEARPYLSWWFEERGFELSEEEAGEVERWLTSQKRWLKLRDWFLRLEEWWRRK